MSGTEFSASVTNSYILSGDPPQNANAVLAYSRAKEAHLYVGDKFADLADGELKAFLEKGHDQKVRVLFGTDKLPASLELLQQKYPSQVDVRPADKALVNNMQDIFQRGVNVLFSDNKVAVNASNVKDIDALADTLLENRAAGRVMKAFS